MAVLRTWPVFDTAWLAAMCGITCRARRSPTKASTSENLSAPSVIRCPRRRRSSYTSLAFGSRCQEVDVRPSMGSVDDAYNNAMDESFFSNLECESPALRNFKLQTEARMAALERGTKPV